MLAAARRLAQQIVAPPPVPAPAAAVVTRTAGRLWSPDAAVNREVCPTLDRADALAGPLSIRVGPHISWAGPNTSTVPIRVGPVTIHVPYPPDARFGADVPTVIVDEADRTVWTVCGYRPADGVAASAAPHPLDGADCDTSAAWGLVLDREVAAASVDHAVAVSADAPVGSRWVLTACEGFRGGNGTEAIVATLATYGAVVVETVPGDTIYVHAARPLSGPRVGPDTGPVYRAAGLATTLTHVGNVSLASAIPVA